MSGHFASSGWRGDANTQDTRLESLPKTRFGMQRTYSNTALATHNIMLSETQAYTYCGNTRACQANTKKCSSALAAARGLQNKQTQTK